MEVDVQVALGADLEVEHGVAGEAFQHVVEKADAGIDVVVAGAVEVERDHDLGLSRVFRSIIAVRMEVQPFEGFRPSQSASQWLAT